MLNFIPMPKEVHTTGDALCKRFVCIQTEDLDKRLLVAANKLPCSENGIPLMIAVTGNEEDNYSLEISDNCILLTANSVRGAFYGIQTLRQYFDNKNLVACKISDTPDYTDRGFYHDVTRGKVPTLKTLKKLVDDMAYYKLNCLQLYVEHTFPFLEYADICEDTGYLTADEIKELDVYCKQNFIELIPSLSCFGHLFELLNQPKYTHLRALEHYEQTHVTYYERMQHHTIDPKNPESFTLIQSLLDQYMPLFSSDKFNICCDETFDLKNGKHKNEDTGELYVFFVKKLIDYLQSKGKQVMMWGDILHQHPERIGEIPEDVVLLNWYYGEDPKPAERLIKPFAEANRKQIVCPGTSTWDSFCEFLPRSLYNIQYMAEYGYQYGAVGFLNTNWGDYGNVCALDVSMIGFAYGAAVSWNIKTDKQAFLRSAAHLVLGCEEMPQSYYTVTEMQKTLYWTVFVNYYSNRVYGNEFDLQFPDAQTFSAFCATCKETYATLLKETWGNDQYRQALLLALEAIWVMAELLGNALGYPIERCTNTADFLQRYRTAWCAVNKESELSKVEQIFMGYEKSFSIR